MKAKVVRQALSAKQSLLVLYSKEILMSTNELDPTLLGEVVSLLQEFLDVFSKQIPSGLPPIRGIEH